LSGAKSEVPGELCLRECIFGFTYYSTAAGSEIFGVCALLLLRCSLFIVEETRQRNRLRWRSVDPTQQYVLNLAGETSARGCYLPWVALITKIAVAAIEATEPTRPITSLNIFQEYSSGLMETFGTNTTSPGSICDSPGSYH
jgi:hypothetical protein